MSIPALTWKETSFFAYDTLCRIRIAFSSETDAEKVLDDTVKAAYVVEKTLNMFDSSSELSQLCASYTPGKYYSVSPMLYEFIELNLLICRITDGSFDPTVGRLIKLWNFLAEHPEIPHEDQINDLLKSVGWQHIHLLENEKKIMMDCPDIQLDPGAAGKGFALEISKRVLQAAGIQHAILDFGGNLFVIGGKAEEADGRIVPWKTALRSPIVPGEIIGSVPLVNSGVATSSWYEHCFKKDGQIFYHILDPQTGHPFPLSIKSVSIISSSASLTDALSTAFFTAGLEKGSTIVNKLRQMSNDSIEYVVVLASGEVKCSEGAAFSAYPHSTNE